MKHKHYDLLMAFANGADIQYRMIDKEMEWLTDANPWWNCERMEFRIKPEPKPDIVRYYNISQFGSVHEYKREDIESWDLEITFDGETGKLKSAEVIK